MPRAISIKATGADNRPLLQLWHTFARLEAAPSMLALNYPPHITFAIYEDVSLDLVTSAMSKVFAEQGPIRLRFSELDCFQQPDFVVWAKPDANPVLTKRHQRLHELLEPFPCHDHYRPRNWVPHCTLAVNISDEHIDEALAVVSDPIEPFEVVFDFADCVAFPPVEILHHIAL